MFNRSVRLFHSKNEEISKETTVEIGRFDKYATASSIVHGSHEEPGMRSRSDSCTTVLNTVADKK